MINILAIHTPSTLVFMLYYTHCPWFFLSAAIGSNFKGVAGGDPVVPLNPPPPLWAFLSNNQQYSGDEIEWVTSVWHSVTPLSPFEKSWLRSWTTLLLLGVAWFYKVLLLL